MRQNKQEEKKYYFEKFNLNNLNEILLIENKAFEFPWNKNKLLDSFNSNHYFVLLKNIEKNILGYFIFMKIIDEGHLLHFVVNPKHQNKGFAKVLMEYLISLSNNLNLNKIYLEVRISNLRAIKIYEKSGFEKISIRKDYYLLSQNKKEDAIVMVKKINK